MAKQSAQNGDLKYLKQRGGRWLVQVAVPSDLRKHFGKAVAEKYLKTSSLAEARRLRHAAVAEIFASFERARQGRPLTDEERKTEGAAESHRLWEWLKANPSDGAQRLHDDYIWPLVGPDGEELDLATLEPRARAIIERIGATPTEESVRAMAQELVNSAFHAHAVWTKGGTPPPPTRDARRSTAPASGTLSIMDAGDKYLAERQRDPKARMTEQTAAQVRTTFRLFSDHMRGDALTAVRRQDAIDFLDALGNLHKHYGHRPGAAKFTLAELLKRFPANGEGLTNKTLNRHQSALKKAFKWFIERGLYSEANPFTELSRPKAPLSKTTWLPFTVPELNLLFAGLKFDKKPAEHSMVTALPWVMAVSLFGGLRQGETCELDAEDLKTRAGIAYFDITEAKSEAGVRVVPLHSLLVKLGFLEYVAAIGKGPLFPGLTPGGHDKKRGHDVARRFPTFKRGRGVTRARTVFHSLRKNFTRALEIAKIDADRAGQVVGHERGFTYRVYNPEGVDLKALRAVVEAVKYPKLKLG